MTTSTLGAAFQFDNTTGEVVSPSIGNSALLSTVADGVGIERDSATGKLRLVAAGANLASGVQRDEMSKFAGAIIKGALADGNGLAGIFSATNSYGTDLVASLDIKYTTIATAACTIDAGVGSAAAIRDGLLDGIDVNTPAAPFVYTSLDGTHAGANGRAKQVWPNAALLHGSTRTGDATGLVGTYAIYVHDIN